MSHANSGHTERATKNQIRALLGRGLVVITAGGRAALKS
jgi:hypothetical protein